VSLNLPDFSMPFHQALNRVPLSTQERRVKQQQPKKLLSPAIMRS
jgi:hypothetical protein